MQHVLIATALFTASCASSAANGPPSTTPTASTGSEGDMVCKEQMRTGSALPARKICRSQIEVDSDRRFVQDTILTPSSRPLFGEPATGPRLPDAGPR